MAVDYEIRTFQAKDYDQLIFLWEQTGLGNPQRGDTLDVILRTIALGGQLYVMFHQEKLIGSSWLSQDGRRIYLHHFGILPGYQGKGLSKPLLEKSLQFARQLNLQIKLEVHKTNEIAIELYKKYGFNYLGDYLVFIIRDYKNLKF